MRFGSKARLQSIANLMIALKLGTHGIVRREQADAKHVSVGIMSGFSSDNLSDIGI